MVARSFRELNTYKKSREATKEIFKLTKKFPKEETFGLTSQIRRSATSVPTNLAEGSGRISGKEKARFSEIAFGSLMEVLNHLILAEDLDFILEKEIIELRPLIDEIGNKINSLRKVQLVS